MKKIVLFVSMLLFLLAGCASDTFNNKNITEPTYNENAQTAIKLPSASEEKQNIYFEDWKYKGFGQDIPSWIYDAIYKKKIPELKGIDYKMTQAHEDNLDQAESKVKETVNDWNDYYYYDSFWVKLKKPIYKKKQYVSIAIYTKINLKEE